MKKGKSKENDIISRDLKRTFPNHAMFQDDSNGTCEGRELLNHVLNCCVHCDAEVGYCQGMGFLIGIFLMYMDEEDAFWSTEALFNNQKYSCGSLCLRKMYAPDFPMLQMCFWVFDQLLHDFFPKLCRHFSSLDQELGPDVYASAWFITLFSNQLCLSVVVRIWDILFNEGIKIIFRVALFLFKSLEKLLLQRNWEECVTLLKGVHNLDLFQKQLEKVEGEIIELNKKIYTNSENKMKYDQNQIEKLNRSKRDLERQIKKEREIKEAWEEMNNPDYVINESLTIRLTRGKIKKLCERYEKTKKNEN